MQKDYLARHNKNNLQGDEANLLPDASDKNKMKNLHQHNLAMHDAEEHPNRKCFQVKTATVAFGRRAEAFSLLHLLTQTTSLTKRGRP